MVFTYFDMKWKGVSDLTTIVTKIFFYTKINLIDLGDTEI